MPHTLRWYDGLRAFFGGVGFILGTPSVWPYAAVPAVIATVLACGLGGLGGRAGRAEPRLGQRLVRQPTSSSRRRRPGPRAVAACLTSAR